MPADTAAEVWVPELVVGPVLAVPVETGTVAQSAVFWSDVVSRTSSVSEADLDKGTGVMVVSGRGTRPSAAKSFASIVGGALALANCLGMLMAAVAAQGAEELEEEAVVLDGAVAVVVVEA